MKVIIIGGGKLGFYLAKTLQEQKHDVVVVETDRRTCTEVLQGLQIPVICGDGGETGFVQSQDRASVRGYD